MVQIWVFVAALLTMVSVNSGSAAAKHTETIKAQTKPSLCLKAEAAAIDQKPSKTQTNRLVSGLSALFVHYREAAESSQQSSYCGGLQKPSGVSHLFLFIHIF